MEFCGHHYDSPPAEWQDYYENPQESLLQPQHPVEVHPEHYETPQMLSSYYTDKAFRQYEAYPEHNQHRSDLIDATSNVYPSDRCPSGFRTNSQASNSNSSFENSYMHTLEFYGHHHDQPSPELQYYSENSQESLLQQQHPIEEDLGQNESHMQSSYNNNIACQPYGANSEHNQQHQMQSSIHTTNPEYFSNSCPKDSDARVGKIKRYILSHEQCMILKKVFKNNPYPSYVHRRSLAEKLDLPEKTIYYWFQNKRKMEKRLGRTNYRATDMPHQDTNIDKFRMILTHDQTNELENEFNKNAFVNPLCCSELSDKLGLPLDLIIRWFSIRGLRQQNHKKTSAI